jgi:hypothetical protein
MNTPQLGPISQELTQFLESNNGTPFYGRIIKVQADTDPETMEYLCEENQLFPFVMDPESNSCSI